MRGQLIPGQGMAYGILSLIAGLAIRRLFQLCRRGSRLVGRGVTAFGLLAFVDEKRYRTSR